MDTPSNRRFKIQHLGIVPFGRSCAMMVLAGGGGDCVFLVV